jgi:predicted dehydrogenase
MASEMPLPIRVALLGADGTTPALARAIAESRRFELAGVCELDSARDPGLAQALAASLGRARHFDHWEALLARDQADVVLVARGRDDDLRAEQLRKLIQTGVPLVASHPVLDSMLLYYELDMIRRDTGSVVVPYLPERHHPAIETLSAMVAQGSDSPLGPIEQVVFSRRIDHTDQDSVTAQFARDVDVIRAVAGDMTRLGAMAGAQAGGNYAGLGVQMSGPLAIAARWSVEPVQSQPGGRLTVQGARGQGIVHLRADDGAWSLDLSSDGKTETRHYPDWQAPAAVLAQLETALAGGTPQPDWVDAARAIELTETIDRSLEKARTIELYYEDYTEEGTFKGTMATIGCGLLILGLCVMGLVAIGDHLGLPYARYWPYLLLAGLGLFLLLQMLMLVFRKPAEPPADPPATAAPADSLRVS